jgi:hypothetical protein
MVKKIILCLSFIIISCQKDLKVKWEEIPQKTFVPKNALDFFDFTTQPLDMPFFYSIDLRWELPQFCPFQIVFKKKGEKKWLKLFESQQQQGQQSLLTTRSNQIYDINVIFLSSNNQYFFEPFTIQIPNDIIFRSNKIITSPEEIINAHRLFIEDDVRIKTENHSLKINVDQLIILGQATMYNFESKERNRKKGRDGGHIYLKARYAQGHLHVVLNGENGGNQTHKPPSKKNIILYRNIPPPQTPDFLKKICEKLKNQEFRRKGKKGENGYPGFDGGSAGHLSVEIFESQNFKLSYEMIPGSGGAGGKGGEGGISEKDLLLRICQYKTFKKGLLEESFGDPGFRGPPGLNGSKGKVSIYFFDRN